MKTITSIRQPVNRAAQAILNKSLTCWMTASWAIVPG
jgi:hypothetical protein